jgi:ABC-2 type transport system permease protein
MTQTRYRFPDVARMEWIKLRSVRSTAWLLVMSVVAMIATGVGVGVGYRSHVPVATAAQIVNNSLAGAVLAQLLVGAAGVLIVTSEYASGLARTTYAAIPRRRTVLAAKAVVFGVVAFAVGEVAAFAGYASGQVAIAGSPVPPASIGDPAILRTVLLTGAYLGLLGLLGLALGVVIRRSGGAIGVLFGVLFVPLFLAAALGSAGIPVLRMLPLFILINSVAVVTPVPGLLPPWGGIGAIAAYGVITLGLGGWLVTRRDV